MTRWLRAAMLTLTLAMLPTLSTPLDHGATWAASPSAYSLTITNCGTTTTYTQVPRRVVTTFDTTSEILIKLGLGARIVGTYYAPVYASEPDIAAAYHRQHVLGGPMGPPSREAVLAAHPDFVFTEAPSAEFGNMGEPTAAQLRLAGTNIYALSGECTTGAALHAHASDIYTDILTIGRIFGVEPRAQALVATMRARIAAVRRHVAARPLVGVVSYVGGTGPLSVNGAGLYTDLLREAGGRNLFGSASSTYPR